MTKHRQRKIPRFALNDAFGVNLEGKKAHLEGTWRAVVGHLEGKGQSQQSLI